MDTKDIERIEVAIDPLHSVVIFENGKARFAHDEDEEMSVLLTLAVASAEADEARRAEDFRVLSEAIVNGLVVHSCRDGQHNDDESRADRNEAVRVAEAWSKQWEHDKGERCFVGCGHRVSESELKRQGF